MTEETSLTTAQHRAIPALLASKTIVAAAAQANVNERTIRRWLSDDVDFQREYSRARREDLRRLVTRLRQRTTNSADTPDNQSPPAAARVSAARPPLGFAYQGIHSENLLFRLKRLEGQLEDSKVSPPTD